jgi:hypothetical protein
MWVCRFALLAFITVTLAACGVDEKEAIAQTKRQQTAIVAVLEAETQHKLQVSPTCFPSWDGKPMWCYVQLYDARGTKFGPEEATALRDSLRLKYNSISASIIDPEIAPNFVTESISLRCEILDEYATPTQRMAGCKPIARY